MRSKDAHKQLARTSLNQSSVTQAVPTVSSGLRREYCCFFLKFYNPGHNGYKKIFNWRHHRVASKKFFWLVTSKLSLATRLVS